MPFVFAHVSDTHLDGEPRASARTAAVMAYLRDLPLDAILVTGDIADHGAPGEYAEAADLLTAPVPVLVLPGNHDERAAFRKGLLDPALPGDFVGRNDAPGGPSPAADDVPGPEVAPINQVRTVGGVTFVLCDSTIPGRDDGRLAPGTLDWLDATLAATAGPVFVALHHPPVRMYNPILDTLLLTEPGGLERVLRRHRHVVAVLCGHAHTAAASTFAGLPLLVGPGVVSTLMLEWEGRGHLSFDDPPGIAFHVLDDGHLTTHYRTVH
ncbi:metallophosphoesterase [Longispora sp. NPDC051575]|uniref:metallophosphoesterase n=1 Tax=Longispora sp. NPDC051575 TaxID=3154943 RepID=UPI003428AEF0